ncbi:MAG: DUF460 domain-containing protein [Candidatus Njordarchaeota archaeon]
MSVLGLDILPDRKNFYAIIIDQSTGATVYRGIIKRQDLLSLIDSYNVSIVAIDNIFEIYESADEIIRFLEQSNVTLIQVTGAPHRQKKLSALAKQHGLHIGDKLSPEKAAEVAAKLALKNEGARVIAIREAVLISVSKSRHFGQVGGSHQKQYLRSAEAKIKTVVRSIIDTLKKNNITYDTFVRESEGGYKSARIIVYAPLKAVKKHIKPTETNWYQIRVEPIRHDRLMFLASDISIESESRGHYLIVGVDPGDTTGIAIIDLKGHVLYVNSRRGIGVLELMDNIYKYGRPLIISTDVPKIPHFVQQISQKSGAIIFRPKKIVSIVRKNEIVKNLGVKVEDSHQRDALVAAFLAYKNYEKKFAKIDNILKYIPIIDSEEVKADVVYHNIDIRTSIINQISRLLNLSQKRKTDYISQREVILLKENAILRDKYVNIKRRIKELESKLRLLQAELKEKEKVIADLNEQIKKLRYEKEKSIIDELKAENTIIMRLTSENNLLKNTINRLEKKIVDLENKIILLRRISSRRPDEIVIKRIDLLTLDSLTQWNKEFSLTKYDIILTKDIIWSRKLGEMLKKTLGIIIYDKSRIPTETLRNLKELNIAILNFGDLSDIIDENQIVQTVKISEFTDRMRSIILEYLDDAERMYEEFIKVLEEYREKSQEEQK